ncbi:MAG: response regulator transcription factor [Planctomycetota bacterium]|jgi:DNA-binding response OmpR family regulator
MPYLLVVDDDKDFASAVQIALEEAGHEVAIKADPKSGLKSIEARKPDLLILDVMFPEDSAAGFEVARTVRSDHKDLPVLMLTAVNQKFPYGFSEKDIDEKFLPVSDFVEKPVDLDVLTAKVAQLLAEKEGK